MELEIITKEDLDNFKKELLDAISDEFAKRLSQQNGDDYLRAKEVRKLLGISEGGLYNLRVKYGLPFHKIGTGTYIYARKDIQKYLTDHRIDYGEHDLMRD